MHKTLQYLDLFVLMHRMRFICSVTESAFVSLVSILVVKQPLYA